MAYLGNLTKMAEIYYHDTRETPVHHKQINVSANGLKSLSAIQFAKYEIDARLSVQPMKSVLLKPYSTTFYKADAKLIQ